MPGPSALALTARHPALCDFSHKVVSLVEQTAFQGTKAKATKVITTIRVIISFLRRLGRANSLLWGLRSSAEKAPFLSSLSLLQAQVLLSLSSPKRQLLFTFSITFKAYPTQPGETWDAQLFKADSTWAAGMLLPSYLTAPNIPSLQSSLSFSMALPCSFSTPNAQKTPYPLPALNLPPKAQNCIFSDDSGIWL